MRCAAPVDTQGIELLQLRVEVEQEERGRKEE